MSVESLLAWLERDVAAECARIAASAEAEAAEIEQRARVAAERGLAAAAERIRAENEREIARSLASVTRQQRAGVLRARADFVDRTFAEAGAILAALALDRYRHRLGELIDEALRYLELGPATIRCPPDAAPAVREMIAGRDAVMVEESAGVAAGIVAVSRGEAVTVDNTWPSRLARRRADLAIALIGRLGEDGGDALG